LFRMDIMVPLLLLPRDRTHGHASAGTLTNKSPVFNLGEDRADLHQPASQSSVVAGMLRKAPLDAPSGRLAPRRTNSAISSSAR
jgi:hypothetical protein